MSKFFELDPEQENKFEVETVRSDEQIEELLEENEFLQQRLAQQKLAPQIDLALAQEVLSVLNEIEGEHRFDNSGNVKFINTEIGSIAYSVLRRGGATEPARLIKNKRRLDLAQWGKPPKEEGVNRGAKFIFKNPDYNPSKEERARLKVWQQRIFDNFFFSGNESSANFSKFIGSAYEDWFDLDDITTEIRRDGLGTPLSIHLSDPIVWKPVVKTRQFQNSFDYENDIILEMLEDYEKAMFGENSLIFNNNIEPDYILRYKDVTLGGATRETVRKHHFFTRTDFKTTQRGFGIVEQGMNIMTWIINALKLNSSNFTHNKIPEGLLLFTGGGIGNMQLQRIKKILSAYSNGPQDQHRFPAASLKSEKGDGKWISFRQSSREMEYHLWITLLFSIFCQLSGTDPREISLGAHSDAIKKSSLNEENTDGIIKESKDVGARTFLIHLQDSLNEVDSSGMNIFEQLTGMPIELQFVGFEIEDKKAKLEITKQELATTKSLNDKLANQDDEKYTLNIDLGGDEGIVNYYDIPGSQSQQLHQIISMKMQNAQQEKQAQMQGQMMDDQQIDPENPEDQEDEMTEDDKRLLDQYGSNPNVEVDEEIKNSLMKDGEDDENNF